MSVSYLLDHSIKPLMLTRSRKCQPGDKSAANLKFQTAKKDEDALHRFFLPMYTYPC